MNYRVPTKREALIMEQNGMNPDSYAVTRSGENSIQLLCYKTRDEIIIFRGDRKWKKDGENEHVT